MIVAHTIHREITARCDERVWAVDVGMSRAYGGMMQLLEISGDRMRVIRPGRAHLGHGTRSSRRAWQKATSSAMMRRSGGQTPCISTEPLRPW
jgi:hypothetical protein